LIHFKEFVEFIDVHRKDECRSFMFGSIIVPMTAQLKTEDSLTYYSHLLLSWKLQNCKEKVSNIYAHSEIFSIFKFYYCMTRKYEVKLSLSLTFQVDQWSWHSCISPKIALMEVNQTS